MNPNQVSRPTLQIMRHSTRTYRLTLVAFITGEEAHVVWMTNDDGAIK
jgi:hypothetical protein